MGKNDFLTPKAIANRIKSKGLQKLRWYCQLCNKQCRDENGFKCHQLSEGHLRQMEVFGQNPARVVEGYSEEFERDFLDHLGRAHPFSRVLAKQVYNELITDKHHIHMNSTKWLTLSDFVKYLGRTGKCKVDETPKGWYITIIREDPMKKLADENRIKRAQHELAEEERHSRALMEQVERARMSAKKEDDEGEAAKELHRDNLDGPISLGLRPSTSKVRPAAVFRAGEADDDDEDMGPSSSKPVQPPKKKSKLDELMEQELQEKARKEQLAAKEKEKERSRTDHWLHEGIVVKVLSAALKPHGYYKQKGVVLQVIDKYIAEIEMLDSGDVIRVDQAELETVLPAPGGTVRAVNGTVKGALGTLVKIDVAKYQAEVELTAGPSEGKKLWMEYEDICKVHKS